METRQTAESREENEVSLDQTYHGLPEGMDDGFINEKETRQTAESRAKNEVSLDQTYADFFLCKELITGHLDGITGVYATPKPYFVAEENPEDFERFELEFNLKNPLQKLKLPGQLA